MAVHGKFYNAFVSINGVDLSDHVKSVTLTGDVNPLDDTVMGDTATSVLPGLKNWQMAVEFVQDFNTSKVDATLWAIFGSASVAIILRPDTALKGTTNPEYTGNAMLLNYPFGGAHGELLMASANFAGDGNFARAIA